MIWSCQKNELPPVEYEYLHLAHTRSWTNPYMDSYSEELDYAVYDMIWLGGDMAHLSSADDATMDYLDGFFDFDQPSTLWALGNHDHSDLNRVENYTGRKAYYHHYQHGINFLVLDTQDSFSNIVGEQLELVNNVLDTIEEGTHLVILHHKLIWLYGHPEFEPKINQISNGPYGECPYCLKT